MVDSKDRISAAATVDQPRPEQIKVDASDADIALAAMGYKPVSTHIRSRVVRGGETCSGVPDLTTHPSTPLGFQARVRTMVRLQFCAVHLGAVRHGHDHILVPSLRRRCCIGRVVLVDRWYWSDVPGPFDLRSCLGLSDFWYVIAAGDPDHVYQSFSCDRERSRSMLTFPCLGAMYFTIKYLAPEKYVPVIAWIDGK